MLNVIYKFEYLNCFHIFTSLGVSNNQPINNSLGISKMVFCIACQNMLCVTWEKMALILFILKWVQKFP
jgi:hypothetical protein